MADNALTGSHIASFKGVKLHKYLSVIVDTRGPRVVVHEFPFRDGAAIETLGRRPHRTEWTVTFTGPDWLDQFMELAQAIDADPSGLLVHPIYGQMQVVCEGFNRATVNVVEATDTIVVPLTFIEDALDKNLDTETTVASATQDLYTYVDDFNSSTSSYDASTQQTCATFSGGASAFATAALASVQTQVADPSLAVQLDAIAQNLGLVQAALLASPLAAQSVAQVYDALAAAELVAAQCYVISDQIALETTSYIRLVVQGRTSITVLAQRIFGANAISYIDLMLQLNPQITDPTNIPAGAVMIIPAAAQVFT